MVTIRTFVFVAPRLKAGLAPSIRPNGASLLQLARVIIVHFHGESDGGQALPIARRAHATLLRMPFACASTTCSCCICTGVMHM